MSKVFLITGTRKGLGRELAEYYLSKGNIVIGCSRRNTDLEHASYHHHELDVTDEKAVVNMIKSVRRAFGRIDVLINNAGIASMNHILTTPTQTVTNIFNTNFLGTFIFTREVSKVMMKNKCGRIVNFSTVATPLRLEGEAAYAASKAAIVNFTETSSKELAQFGITVNAVGPTPVPTDLIKNIPKHKLQELLDQQAINRFGAFEDVLNVVEFFVSEKSNFITGQVIYLGGVCR